MPPSPDVFISKCVCKYGGQNLTDPKAILKKYKKFLNSHKKSPFRYIPSSDVSHRPLPCPPVHNFTYLYKEIIIPAHMSALL